MLYHRAAETGDITSLPNLSVLSVLQNMAGAHWLAHFARGGGGGGQSWSPWCTRYGIFLPSLPLSISLQPSSLNLFFTFTILTIHLRIVLQCCLTLISVLHTSVQVPSCDTSWCCSCTIWTCTEQKEKKNLTKRSCRWSGHIKTMRSLGGVNNGLIFIDEDTSKERQNFHFVKIRAIE